MRILYQIELDGVIENVIARGGREYVKGKRINNFNNYKYVLKSPFEFSNPHPENKRVKDCVKRAFTIATGEDYMAIQRELNRIKRETNLGNDAWREFIKRRGWRKLSFPAEFGLPRMNGKNFVLNYPKGIYVLRMARHLATVKDGKLLDTWDSSNKCVYNAWEVK